MYGFVSLLSVAVTYINFLLLFPILKPLLAELFYSLSISSAVSQSEYSHCGVAYSFFLCCKDTTLFSCCKEKHQKLSTLAIRKGFLRYKTR